MKRIFSIILVLAPLAALTQPAYDSSKLSPLVKALSSKIDSCTRGNWYYHCNFTSELKLLGQRAKIYELRQLVNHPNPFVRLNTFSLLLDSACPAFVDILEEHINDTASVYLWSGHDAEPTNVIEGMIILLSYNTGWIGMKEFAEADEKRLSDLIDLVSRRKNHSE